MIAKSFSSLSRVGVAGLLAVFAMSASFNQADAAHPTKHASHTGQKAKGKGRKHAIHGPNYHPPYAAIVVDDNTAQVLHGSPLLALKHLVPLAQIVFGTMFTSRDPRCSEANASAAPSGSAPKTRMPSIQVARTFRSSSAATRSAPPNSAANSSGEGRYIVSIGSR